MKKERFERLLNSARQAADHAHGRADESGYRVYIPHELDVRAIRKRLGFTQQDFATTFGFNVARLRDWEQGRTHPDAALRAYLLVIDRKPDAVREALAA
jgi:putative transcriptional regulator